MEHARAGRTLAGAFAAFQIRDLSESAERAQKAYNQESVPVAIYAMTELLDRQQAAEKAGETAFLSRQIIATDLMLTHARLAKLYGAAAQPNMITQHITEALRYAKIDTNLAITNQDTLMSFLARIDKGAK